MLVAIAGALGMGSLAQGETPHADTTRPASAPPHYASEAGRLPRRYVAPDVYEGSGQNWDAVQDSTGRLVVANSDGVLVYDGRS